MKKNSSSIKTFKLARIALFAVFCLMFANTTIAQTKILTAVASPPVWATGTWTAGVPATSANKVELTQLGNTIPLSTIDNTYYSRRLQTQNSATSGLVMEISSTSTSNAMVIDIDADAIYTSGGYAVNNQANKAIGTKLLINCNVRLNNTFSTTSNNRHNVLRTSAQAANVLEFGPNSVLENIGFGPVYTGPFLGKVIMNGKIKAIAVAPSPQTNTFVCGAASATNVGFTEFGPNSDNTDFNLSDCIMGLAPLADVTVNTAANGTFFKNTLGGKLQFNNFADTRSATIRFTNANVWNSILRSSTGSSDGITGANVIINDDQTTNVGAIEMVQGVISSVNTGSPVINLTVAAGKSVTFGDSSANIWVAGGVAPLGAGSKLNIYGFDAAASIKFGSSNTALTATQLAMIVIKDGASMGQSVGLDVTGKLVLASLSIEDKFAQFAFKSYPNPAKNVINIAAAKNIETVSFFNVLGQKVQSDTINAAQKQVDISNLQNGVYLMEVTIDDAKQTYKIIKQ